MTPTETIAAMLGWPIAPETSYNAHYLDRNPEAAQFRATSGGATEVEYLLLLAAMVGVFKPTVILETGTLGGDGTIALLAGAEPGATVITVAEEQSDDATAGRIATASAVARCRVRHVRGHTKQIMVPGQHELADATGGRCTFVFLDTAIRDRGDEFAFLVHPDAGVLDRSRPCCVCIHDLSPHRHALAPDAEFVESTVQQVLVAGNGDGWQSLRLHQSRGMLVMVRMP